MKIKLYSDLHLEFSNFIPKDDGEDLVILAGDIDVGTDAIPWILKHFETRLDKVIYLPGNHEYYNGDLVHTRKKLLDACDENGIKNLVAHGSYHVVGDYVIMGGTLWTSFDLWPDRRAAMSAVMRGLNDYYCITHNGDPLGAVETRNEHLATMQHMTELVQQFSDKKIIVATHMAPSITSCAEVYKSDIITSAYCSRLEPWILDRSAIKLWVHGHMHSSSDYMIGDCHVVANPRGYSRGGRNENKSFDENLIIEV